MTPPPCPYTFHFSLSHFPTLNILFLSRRYFPAVSGMSVYARNMTRALAQRGHDVTMISQYREDEVGVRVYGGGPPPDEPWMRVVGMRSVGEELGSVDPPADWERDMRDMVARSEELHAETPFDVVHAQYCYPTGLAAMEVSRRLGIPNVVSIQGGDGHWVGPCCRTHQRAMDAVLGHAGALVIGCDSFRAEVIENHGTPKERFTIVPGATNTDQFRPPEEVGALRSPARLLYHGRVDARKGSIDFVRAGRQLLDRGHDVRLVISGIGPDFDATREEANKLGMADRVEMPGAATYAESPARYASGDVFVSPTYAEGFSNTILEAMATGLPIVSTATVGVIDAVDHERNGLLHEPGDVEAQVELTERLLTDAVLRKRLAENALQDVREKYSWPVVAGQIEDVYKAVLAAPIDTSWTDIISVDEPVEEQDLSCRFRTAPQLL